MKPAAKASVLLVLALSVACTHNPPNTVPGSPDPYLKAATNVGAIVQAVQAAEIVFYNSGSSGLSTTDQATVQKVFADTSQTVLNAIDTYSAAKSATTQKGLVDAIVLGVNNIVLQFAKFTNPQFQAYTKWVNTALTLVDLLVPGTALRAAVPIGG